jgi:hypothetical protein
MALCAACASTRLQADIAADLIRRGLAVHAFDQRSVTGILDMNRFGAFGS